MRFAVRAIQFEATCTLVIGRAVPVGNINDGLTPNPRPIEGIYRLYQRDASRAFVD
jgi:hypothetical protein